MQNEFTPTSAPIRPTKAPISRQVLLGVLGLVVLVTGALAAVMLTQKNSDNRQQAASSGINGTTVRGYFDNVDAKTCKVITGWACDAKDYSKALQVGIYVDQVDAAHLITDTVGLATVPRSDLAPECGGTVNHGYSLALNSAKAQQLLGDGKAHKLIPRAAALTGTTPSNYVSDLNQGSGVSLPSASTTSAPDTITCNFSGDTTGGGITDGACKAVTVNGTIAYNSKVSLTCTPVAGATRYEFRIKLPDGTIKTINPSAAGSANSQEFTINQVGGFKAQCRGCTGAGAETCPAYEAI
jgi:hypothetical protein